MKKIMFNDKYGLTEAVLERRKTQTRRILNPTMLFERLNTYEGWEKEDIADWKKCCKDRLYEANGEELKEMLDYALVHSTYKVGDKVLFNENRRFGNVLYNNLKGRILSIDKKTNEIVFQVLVDKVIDKRDALKKKTGFDVTVAIANMQKEKEDMDAPAVESKERRVKTESAPEGRRTIPKYNVVQPTTTAKLDK